MLILSSGYHNTTLTYTTRLNVILSTNIFKLILFDYLLYYVCTFPNTIYLPSSKLMHLGINNPNHVNTFPMFCYHQIGNLDTTEKEA